MNGDNINNYVPSILNPRVVKKDHSLSLTQSSVISRCSLSLKRQNGLTPRPAVKPVPKVPSNNKENFKTLPNLSKEKQRHGETNINAADKDSLGLSLIEDLLTTKELDTFSDLDFDFITTHNIEANKNSERSCISHASTNDSNNTDAESVSTIIYNVNNPLIQVSFGVNDCENLDVNTKNGTIQRIFISRNDKNTDVDCEIHKNSQISTDTELDDNMNENSLDPRKRSAVAVSLEIKKQKLMQNDSAEKVLIFKTNAVEKISHIIVQPPNYKFVNRNISGKSNVGYCTDKSSARSRNVESLKQVTLEGFFRKADAVIDLSRELGQVGNDDAPKMSKNCVIDVTKCNVKGPRSNKKEASEPPKSARLPSKRDTVTLKHDFKSSNSETPSPKPRNESFSAHTPKNNVESSSINFSLATFKNKTNKTAASARHIPHHKIVAETHFAVDAFSYGDIPNVKHYFLTHFHSDHYSGLKKTFNKLLYCSKITANLCTARLGVNPKNITILNVDEPIKIDGVEISPIDANHCPGALMLVFTLPNRRSLLHTGDFRACPSMESHPLFWNKDIHTIYLDTTYCNPRYDFPTQDQSLEIALSILRQKKIAIEKANKKFSSVLIVCGTYTIGKEKFFLGLSRRVGCSIWTCPEKERVLQTVEGRAWCREPPRACQLHLVPMRDLTIEKLRSYLDGLQGAFAEVVAFKPSGWENGKNNTVEKDCITIHGIPYSEHSSFSELIRFVKFLKPKQVVPTVDISGGIKSVQKYFPCPLVHSDEMQCQTKVTDYFSIHNRHQVATVT